MAKSFRQVLDENNRKTKMVIFVFLLLYTLIGLLIDVASQAFIVSHGQYYNSYTQQPIHFNAWDAFMFSFYQLITFEHMPWATIIMFVVAVISVFLSFMLYDRAMLMGTEYILIDPNKRALNNVEKQLYNIIDELRIAARLQYMPKIYIIDADYMNAFASGYSEKSAMVAITKGLINKLNRAEIQAVMAHELSHIRHGDIKLTLMATILVNIMLITLDLFLDFSRFGFFARSRNDRDNGGVVSLIAFFLLLALRIVLPIITFFMMMFLSRTREYMADAGSVELTRDNTALASALLKIQGDYQSHSYVEHKNTMRQAAYIYNPFKGTDSWFSTHPSLENRLKAMGVELKK
jgi:heat shock protein HtpX